MADTANLGVFKIDVNVAQKEVIANEAFDVFDAAFSEIAITMSDANYTLSSATTPKEWQYGTIKLSGALSADRNVIVPNNKKTYQVVNGTSGGHSIIFKTSAGTGITVTNGATAIVRCDGTNVVAITGGSGAGTVTSVGVTSTDLSVSGSPVTTSGNITLNIANNVVTYAKMQDVSATDKILGRSTAGSGDVEEITCTAAGRALIDDADAAAQRATLGLGTSATLDVDTDPTMAANSASRVPAQSALVSYIATQLDGRSWKQRVRVATTANGTLATAFANGQTVDGVTLATGDRILIKNQTTGSENGIYVVAASGAPTRSSDADTGTELVNATVEVSEGTTNADLQFTCSTNAPITVGTTALMFVLTSTSTTYTADETTLHLSGAQFSLLSTAPVTHAATSKTTPVDADELGIVDSAASNVLKKLTWANLKATLKTYFDTLYLAVSVLTTKGDVLVYGSSAARLPVGTDGDVLTADSTQSLGVKWAAGGGGGSVDAQVFTSSGTWNKPAGCTVVKVVCVGAGGGGGGASGGSSGSVRHGASGGGGGAITEWIYKASDLSSSVSVTVGAGGTGGAGGVSAGGSAGNAGGK
ncbi:hypothetical protein ACHMW6_06700 [Pseudoduganella sp. UC29_106]|uniref:glycine-rich domain-containing protein n=1 Tax=Pseudoduganella sp. UC29_106 TaxID=3374553 RepID=UPI0037570A2F